MMGKDTENGPEEQDYQFMKETIKKKPLNIRKIAGRAVLIAAGGALFGLSGAYVFSWTTPSFMQKFGIVAEDSKNVKLAQPTPSQSEAEEGTGGLTEDGHVSEGTDSQSQDPLNEYGKIYSKALEVSEEPRKALVTVAGVSENADLLDNSILSYGDTEGIIFLESGSWIYILTECKKIEKAQELQITFCDSSTAKGEICRTDEDTGLAVVRVRISGLSKQTKNGISIALLGKEDCFEQAMPVIAIGRPTGDRDTVLYGIVTAVTSRFSAADAEYNLITTDIQGTTDGSGVLLDINGDVVGLITKKGEGENNIIRALSVSQLRPLIELMSNGASSRYLGIRGATISPDQAKRLEIPQGVYVEGVDDASPAMDAGIQNGDIITALGGREVKNMQEYAACLQQQKQGDKVKIAVSRSDSTGEFVDVTFEAVIKDR